MNRRGLAVIGFCLLTLGGCGKSYSMEEAVKNGDIVTTPEQHHMDRFATFLKHVDEKEKDTIRITNYTTEGDAILEDVSYDGKRFTYSLDSSRDAYGSQTDDRNKEICQNLEKRTENERSVFFLTDCEEGEDHEILVSDVAESEQ
ncbi:DUF4362 domain-containing protein [Exiguobacterium sp. RIT452]|uniref:DUF4362 domain-containing protein n=1 Tax=Exiguobacterium TaxID=33986 RepID=UPI00047BC1B3|nr:MULTISPECIES: DUF4362 domain-containing protein [Exiguobacterium]RJP02579.1 DUF4362 domain-containing protein [Exiguobacterium sp. RIT452]